MLFVVLWFIYVLMDVCDTRISVSAYSKMLGRPYGTVLRWAKHGILPAPARPWTDPGTGRVWVELPLSVVEESNDRRGDGSSGAAD